MKQIIKLGANKYVTLDSYGASHESQLREQAIVIFIGLLIAALTLGALVGMDITDPDQRIKQERIK